MAQYKIFIDGAHIWKLHEDMNKGWPNILSLISSFSIPRNAHLAEVVVIDGDPAQMWQFKDEQFGDRASRADWHREIVAEGFKLELVGFKTQNICDRQAIVQKGGDTLIATHAALAIAAGYSVAIMTNDSDFIPPLRLLSGIKNPMQSLECWMCSATSFSFNQEIIAGSVVGYLVKTFTLSAQPGSPARRVDPRGTSVLIQSVPNLSAYVRMPKNTAVAKISDSPLIAPTPLPLEADADRGSPGLAEMAESPSFEDEPMPLPIASSSPITEELWAEAIRCSQIDLLTLKSYPDVFNQTRIRTGRYPIMNGWLTDRLAYTNSLTEISSQIFSHYSDCSWVVQVPVTAYPWVSSGNITTTRTLASINLNGTILILLFANRLSPVIATGFELGGEPKLDGSLVGLSVPENTTTKQLSRQMFVQAIGSGNVDVPFNVLSIDGHLDNVNIVANMKNPGTHGIIPTKVGQRWMYSILFYHRWFHRS